MKKNKVNIWIVVVLISLLLTGCWDLIEIDQRALITAIALDKKGDKIAISYASPNLPVLTGQGGEGEKNFVKKTTGATFLEANKNFNKISNLKLTFEHNQVIIFGDEFLQDSQKLKSALDYFERSPDYALSIAVITTDKTGEKLLESEPNSVDPIGVYINSLFQPSSGKEIGEQKTSLNDFVTALYDTNGNGQLPKVVYKDKEVQFDGIVLLKDYKKHFTLNTDQLIPFNWVQGKGEDSIVIVEYEESKLSYEISQIKQKIKVKEVKEGLTIEITVDTEGDIDEYIMEEDKDVFEKKIIEEIEKLIKEKMEEEMFEMIRLIQKEVGFDAFNLSGKIKLQNGKLWKKIEDDWDEYFSSAKISIVTQPHIRRVGMSK